MFSISFGEMFFIVIILLVVVGPKRLPEMARFCGHLFGKFNRQMRTIRREIKQEMEMEDLKQIAKETEESVKNIDTQVKDAIETPPTPTKPSTTAATSKPTMSSTPATPSTPAVATQSKTTTNVSASADG